MSDTEKETGVILAVGLATPAIAAVIVVLTLPLTIWEAFAINTVLRWHLPSLAIGVIPITVLGCCLRQVTSQTTKPEDEPKISSRVIRWLFAPAVLLFIGWTLRVVEGWLS